MELCLDLRKFCERKKEFAMSFGTVVNCMDGRVQGCVADYMKSEYGVKYVDTITEAGPVKLIAEDSEGDKVVSILEKIGISVNCHKSEVITVAAHVDCAGNPVDDDVQKGQVKKSVEFIKSKFGQCEVIGLWIGDDWKAEKI